ncbi:MAG: tetratricopeptide repeat protein [Bacteroidota bacterium]
MLFRPALGYGASWPPRVRGVVHRLLFPVVGIPLSDPMKLFPSLLTLGLIACMVSACQPAPVVYEPASADSLAAWVAEAEQARLDGRADEALAAYRKAAQHGDPFAQTTLGGIHRSGTIKGGPDGMVIGEVDADRHTSDFWYQQAADTYRSAMDQGDLDAQVRFASVMMHINPEHREESMRLFRDAAQKGHPETIGTVAWLVHWSDGDYEVAVDMSKQAAELGYARAANLVAMAYMQGRGVTRDYDEARRWLERAAQGGDKFAQRDLELARNTTGSAQL